MKRSFLVGLAAMLVVGFILASVGCSSTPSVNQNEWLLQTAANGFIAGVQYALENGEANINYQSNSYRGRTALILASYGGLF